MKYFQATLFCGLVFMCSIFDATTSFNNENSFINLSSTNDTLISAHIIFRHGDRNVEGTYPNDPHRNESFWPEGFGQLTKRGKQRAFRLGEFLRRRYNKLLGEKYSAKNIFVQSTDVDRTLMSAQLVLAALFIPTADEKWNEQILWQPIAVHASEKKSCPKHAALLANYLKQSKKIQQIYTNYADLFTYWRRMSGSNITTIFDVFDLYDTLKVEREQNKTLPKWANKATLEPMEYIGKVSHNTYASTPSMARISFGFLLKEMLDHLTQKINSTLDPDRSVWLYSAHDSTVLNVLNGLRIHDLHLPNYSSCLMFELHRSTHNEHFVQLFYRRSEKEHNTALKIPKCGEKCPLNEFEALYSDIIPGEFESECRLS